jgi:hypothetical protein
MEDKAENAAFVLWFVEGQEPPEVRVTGPFRSVADAWFQSQQPCYMEGATKGYIVKAFFSFDTTATDYYCDWKQIVPHDLLALLEPTTGGEEHDD